jgi:hypothetical protein
MCTYFTQHLCASFGWSTECMASFLFFSSLLNRSWRVAAGTLVVRSSGLRPAVGTKGHRSWRVAAGTSQPPKSDRNSL